MRSMLLKIIQGLAVGVAIILPGLSGGTAIVLLGMYRSFLRDLARLRLRPYLPHFFGAAAGGLSGIRVIGYLIEHHTTLLMSFLLGMLVASLRVVALHAGKIYLGPAALLAGAAGFAAAWLFSGEPAHGFTAAPDSLIFYFTGGAISSATMLLPGVSGGAILVAMGLYDNVIEAVNSRQWPILLTLGGGFAVGLLGFARLLFAAYRRWGNLITLFLMGLIAGSTRSLIPAKVDGGVIAATLAGALLVLAASRCSAGSGKSSS